MNKKLQTEFSTRQYMLSKDFEIYYYSDTGSSKVASHTHGYYEFYFFMEGDVSIEISGKEYPLIFGDVVIIPPGVKHRALIHNDKSAYRRFVFWISSDYLRHLMAGSASYGYILQRAAVKQYYILHNDLISFNLIQSKIFQLIEEVHSDRFGKDARIPLCVNDLIFHLNRVAYDVNHEKNAESSSDLYHNLLDFINDHLDEDLSLDRLAGEFYISSFYMSHLFKEKTGLSVHRYIIKKRLAACKAAIKASANISETCYLYGFKDYTSFYRAFKKEYGISPRDCCSSGI